MPMLFDDLRGSGSVYFDTLDEATGTNYSQSANLVVSLQPNSTQSHQPIYDQPLDLVIEVYWGSEQTHVLPSFLYTQDGNVVVLLTPFGAQEWVDPATPPDYTQTANLVVVLYADSQQSYLPAVPTEPPPPDNFIGAPTSPSQRPKRKRPNALNPQITVPYSDLQTLAKQAIVRYGDFAPGVSQGELMPMFVELANLVIDEIHQHPYWIMSPTDRSSRPRVRYYTHYTDIREVPDQIIVAGLLAMRAAQQQSQPKMAVYVPNFTRILSAKLWDLINGNAPISITPRD